MRYAQGGGLTAEGGRRREQVRLEAARRFEQRVPSAVIAAELRVSERSVRRWRQAWQAGGPAGLASRGQAAQCRLDEQQLAALDLALEAGPLAAGWEDQRWTLARVRALVARRIQGAVHHPGDLVSAATARLDLPAGRAAGHRARRRRGRGVEEGDLAADKPADYAAYMTALRAKLSEPGRMAEFLKTFKSTTADADAQLPHVSCPALVIMGTADPDFADPQAEAEAIVAAMPAGLGTVAMIKGAGHYPHAQNPDEVAGLITSFLKEHALA